MENRLTVIMPPEFEYLPGLFLPDLDRARLVHRAAVMVKRWRSYGYSVFLDAGVHGLTAAQTAKRLEGSAAVLGGPRDAPGARILVEALGCGRPFLSTGDPAEVLGRLEKRVESLATMELPLSGEVHDLSGAFLIGDSPGSFRSEGKALVRTKTGRAASLPAWVKKIHLVDAGDAPPEMKDDELVAFVIPGKNDDPAPWLETCRAMERKKLRLTVEGGGLGLERPAVRRLLEELDPRVGMVLGFREICADPLEEMYAGNSLPDRNAELIENIVP